MKLTTQHVAQDRALFAEQIVGVVSHDLRTPLTAIRIGVDLLGVAELDPSLMRLVSRMNGATRRAQRLIEDLLDFTQARMGGRLPVVRQPMNIHTCVGDALAELSLAFPSGHFVHVKTGDGDCIGDRDRLVQALSNLVANAVAYGDPGRPIAITSATRGHWCAVSVHNEGKVIVTSSVPTLFEPMVRGDAGWSKSRSIGLGLFIVREIARAHMGDVVAASSRARGTRFTIRFPARPPEVRVANRARERQKKE